MNIPVLTYSGKVVVRPDTTWKRDDDSFYAPEFVDRVTWAPVLYAHVSRPGRSVGERFASRYFDGVGFGMLLYPENLIDGCTEGFAMASCIDHTSFLSHPAVALSELGDSLFELKRGEKSLFSCKPDLDSIEKAIAEVTKYCYIRNGDFLAVELAPRQPLCGRGDSPVDIAAFFGGNRILDFKVVL